MILFPNKVNYWGTGVKTSLQCVFQDFTHHITIQFSSFYCSSWWICQEMIKCYSKLHCNCELGHCSMPCHWFFFSSFLFFSDSNAFPFLHSRGMFCSSNWVSVCQSVISFHLSPVFTQWSGLNFSAVKPMCWHSLYFLLFPLRAGLRFFLCVWSEKGPRCCQGKFVHLCLR
jgi:hypothetical protein